MKGEQREGKQSDEEEEREAGREEEKGAWGSGHLRDDLDGLSSLSRSHKQIQPRKAMVEIVVHKIYCINRALPTLPVNIEDAARSEVEIEKTFQGEAIARNLFEMFGFEVPMISIVLGEVGFGGALAIACANKLLMLENAVFYVAKRRLGLVELGERDRAGRRGEIGRERRVGRRDPRVLCFGSSNWVRRRGRRGESRRGEERERAAGDGDNGRDGEVAGLACSDYELRLKMGLIWSVETLLI
ncbi:hypothetical protein Droror1_Dr00012756 [Drosera rotundifolia]